MEDQLHPIIDRHLHLIRARRHGAWIGAQDDLLVTTQMLTLASSDALTPAGRRALGAARIRGVPYFDTFFGNVLGNVHHFRNPAQWALFWAVHRATHEVLLLVPQGAHEPVLTGALIANIRCSLHALTAWSEPPAPGLNSTLAVYIADHAALWNERHTGADFGLIIETVRDGTSLFFVTLVQAKRATWRTRGIDETQARLLVKSGVGTYLFYNEFDFPVGTGRGLIAPTAKGAKKVLTELEQNGGAVNPLHAADDFASRIAFGMLGGLDEGHRRCGNADEALMTLFDPDVPGVRPNHVLVSLLADRQPSAKYMTTYEAAWRTRVLNAMRTARKADKKRNQQPSPATSSP